MPFSPSAVVEFIYTVLLKPRPLRKAAQAILRAIIPRSVRYRGATIVLNPRDPVVSGALTFRVYETVETKFFLSVSRPGMTFLDIGANIGYYTALALSQMKDRGRIVSLEPDLENFGFLQRNVAANRGEAIVSCIRKAAADHSGVMTLHTSANNRGDNRLYANEMSQDSCTVEVEPVDTLLAGLGVSTVDLIKMDVQGFEAHVLAGMLQTIARSPRIVILSEFWPHGLRSAGSDPWAYLETLRDLGLTVCELTARSTLAPIEDSNALIQRFSGRHYTNIVAFRGDALPV
jgi:FkbM family methyltransferase